jgi:hypothetical protein
MIRNYILTSYFKVKVGKVVPLRSIEAHFGDWRYSSYPFLTWALEGGERSASRPDRALPPGKEPPVPTVQEAYFIQINLNMQQYTPTSPKWNHAFTLSGQKVLYACLFSPHHFIILDLIILIKFVEGTNYKDSHCIISSSLQLLHPT